VYKTNVVNCPEVFPGSVPSRLYTFVSVATASRCLDGLIAILLRLYGDPRFFGTRAMLIIRLIKNECRDRHNARAPALSHDDQSSCPLAVLNYRI